MKTNFDHLIVYIWLVVSSHFWSKTAGDNRLSAAIFGPKWLVTTGCQQPSPSGFPPLILIKDQLLKERTCSPRRIFAYRVDLILEKFVFRESKKKVAEVVSLCKNGRNRWRHTHSP